MKINWSLKQEANQPANCQESFKWLGVWTKCQTFTPYFQSCGSIFSKILFQELQENCNDGGAEYRKHRRCGCLHVFQPPVIPQIRLRNTRGEREHAVSTFQIWVVFAAGEKTRNTSAKPHGAAPPGGSLCMSKALVGYGSSQCEGIVIFTPKGPGQTWI